MSHIDFTELKKRNKAYAGANGNKISVIYEGEQYMLKFPTQAKRNQGMSYSNSCFSEYLGCQIYESRCIDWKLGSPQWQLGISIQC